MDALTCARFCASRFVVCCLFILFQFGKRIVYPCVPPELHVPIEVNALLLLYMRVKERTFSSSNTMAYTCKQPLDYNYMMLLWQMGYGKVGFSVQGYEYQLVGAPTIMANVAAIRTWLEAVREKEIALRVFVQKCMDEQEVSAQGLGGDLVQKLHFSEKVMEAPTVPLYFRLDTQNGRLSNSMLLRIIFHSIHGASEGGSGLP